MVYQVGNPAMLEGKRFLPLTGTPMRKMLRKSTLLADCDPDPLTVATWMLKSFTTLWATPAAAACGTTSVDAMKIWILYVSCRREVEHGWNSPGGMPRLLIINAPDRIQRKRRSEWIQDAVKGILKGLNG